MITGDLNNVYTDVADRLRRGGRIRGERRELIASDIAFRAMKDLVRDNGSVRYLNAVDVAALRWAGVDPSDHSTWFLHRGDCR